MDTPLLWHIPLSHYSEKVRWALDYKGIAHRRRVLGPDYLIRVWRATRQGQLPVLWLDGQAIADSTRIIAELEEAYPEPALYPRDTATRQRALALEDDFDETLGPALRAAIVTPLFRHDPDIALRVLTTGMGSKAYRTLRPLLQRGDDSRGISDGPAVEPENGQLALPRRAPRADQVVGAEHLAAMRDALVVERPADLLVEMR